MKKKSKEQLISEAIKMIDEGRKARSQMTLKEVVQDMLYMIAETNPGFEDRCAGLLDIMDSWEGK